MSSPTSHMLHLVIICSIRVARVHSMSIKRNIETSLLYGALHSSYNQFGNSIFKIFSLLIIHSHDRTSSIIRVHTTTWDYFTEHLAVRFFDSPRVVKEEIMTDINDLVQEFRTSSNGVVASGTSFIAFRRLFKILQRCFNYLNVCFVIISVFATAVDLADKNPQLMTDLRYCAYDEVSLEGKFHILFDGYRKMLDQSFCKSNDLADMLRFLPGVVVQKSLSMQGMADLYRIKQNFLDRLVRSTIEEALKWIMRIWVKKDQVESCTRVTEGVLSCLSIIKRLKILKMEIPN